MRDEIARQIADEVLAVYGGYLPEKPVEAIPLTRAQQGVLDVIIEFRIAFRLSPTLKEIGEELGVSKVTICEHLREIERKGWIKREPRLSRAIIVIDGRTRRGTSRLMILARAYEMAK